MDDILVIGTLKAIGAGALVLYLAITGLYYRHATRKSVFLGDFSPCLKELP
jgi:hypothetical protein